MKTITLRTDWLDQVCGLTVAGAIEYLSTLDPNHKLNAFMDGGDTHGVELRSELYFERPYTEDETAQIRAQRLERERKRLEDAAAYWRKEYENPPAFADDPDGAKKTNHVEYAKKMGRESLDKLAALFKP